jgi:protein SCO1/2
MTVFPRRRPAALGLARAILLTLTLSLTPLPALAALPEERPEVKGKQFSILKKVEFDQNLDALLPLDTPLRDESGREVQFGDYFGKKPVVVLFVYFECPMLCTLELNGLVRNLRALSMTAGREFEIVTVSIDPKETPRLASAKKGRYLKIYNRPGAEAGWHFLTGAEGSVRRLAGVAGFRYEYDPNSGQYAHPAGLIVATPQGRISRYIYGVDFPASNLRWALVEASAGKIGSPVDKVLLMCFHYDPATGRYNFAVMTLLRVLGVATACGLAAYMTVMIRRERRRLGAGGVLSAEC